MQAEGQAQWLQAHWFTAQQRKHGVTFAVVDRTKVHVLQASSEAAADEAVADDAAAAFEAHWRKAITSAVKKVEVEDLGDMD